MVVGIFSMFVLVLFMLAGGVPVDKGDVTTVFHTPAFIIAAFIFCIAILYECWLRRRSWKRLSFFITHLSIVAILVGCLVGMFFTVKSEFSLKVGREYVYREVPGPRKERSMQGMGHPMDSGNIPLGFGIAVDKFDVEHFPAEYDMFLPVEKTDPYGQKHQDYDYSKTYYVKNGDFKFDNGTVVSVDQLRNKETGRWSQQHIVEGVGILQLAPLRDKHYEVELLLLKDEEGEDTELRKMKINYPVTYNGWKLYLMSYDKQYNQYITISARRDPGRILVVGGFWALMLGVVMMCFGASVVKGGRRES